MNASTAIHPRLISDSSAVYQHLIRGISDARLLPCSDGENAP